MTCPGDNIWPFCGSYFEQSSHLLNVNESVTESSSLVTGVSTTCSFSNINVWLEKIRLAGSGLCGGFSPSQQQRLTPTESST